MYKKMKLVAMCVGISCLLCSFIPFNSVHAAGYPEQPIVIVNPWGTGGASDNALTVFRTFGEKFFGVPILVSQRKGATGTIGTNFVANAKPDGYTLGLATSDPTIVVPHFRDIPYDPFNLTYIAQWAIQSDCFAVRADLPIKTLQEFHDYAKNNPGKVRIGQAGADGESYLFHKRLEDLWKIKMINIPFDSTGEATIACVGGQIEAITAGALGIKPMIDAGKLRVIAVIGTLRDPLFPDIKSCKEMGVDAVFDEFYGFLGPPNLPPEIVTFVESKTKAMMEDPEVRKAFNRIGVPLAYANSKDFTKKVKDDFVLFRRLIKGQ